MSNIILNFKHSIRPSSSQARLLDDQIFAANQVYNIVLNLLQRNLYLYNIYKDTGIAPPLATNTAIDRHVNSILKKRNIYGETDTRQQERAIATTAFWDGIKSEKGSAKFRSSDNMNGAFSGVNARTTFGDNWIQLSKRMGKIKMKRERPFPDNSKVKSVRIKKELGKYYAIISIELLDEPQLTKKDYKRFTPLTHLGMDTNNGSVDFSDGTRLKYERTYHEKELLRMRKIGSSKSKTKNQKRITKLLNEFKKIKRLEQAQSRRIDKAKRTKVKTGKNYSKDKLALGKLKRKQQNRRKNLLDKLSNDILDKLFDVLFIEDLSVKDMTKKQKSEGMNNKQMRKNILNFSYSELHAKLIYKAMRIGRLVVKVDPAYTSQTCSKCGSRKKLKLSDRLYNCDGCGLEIGRDHNAAKNIERKGFEIINVSTRSREAA